MFRSPSLLSLLRRCAALHPTTLSSQLAESPHAAASYLHSFHSAAVLAAGKAGRGGESSGLVEARQHQQQPSPSLSPLQRCLLRRGIPDVPHWGNPHLSHYSEEWVTAHLEPKLAALATEGVGAALVARLLRSPHPLLPASSDAFLSNLSALRELLQDSGIGSSDEDLASSSPLWAPGMTAVGLLVARAPGCLANYLSREPGSLAANAAWFGQQLGIGRGQLGAMVFKRPCVLTINAGPPLLEVLALLDELACEAGWGRRLLALDPVVATASPGASRCTIEILLDAGYRPLEVCSVLEKHANLLVLELGPPAAVARKLEWIRHESGWPLGAFLEEPRFLTGDLRAAPRLAFLREQGAEAPPGPDRALCVATDAAFCAAAGRLLGRELREAEWNEWLEKWHGTPEGRRWGP